MKSNKYSLSFLIVSTILVHSNSQGSYFEKYAPTLWLGGIMIEAINRLSPSFQENFYGNCIVTRTTKKIINEFLESQDLFPIENMKTSHLLWKHTAGNVFSNHKTLFISNETQRQIRSGIINDSLKKELLTAALCIHKDYDGKILAASLLIPMGIWMTAYGMHKFLNYLKETNNSDFVDKIAKKSEQFKNSFYVKSSISLALLAAFIFFQKQDIARSVEALLNNK